MTNKTHTYPALIRWAFGFIVGTIGLVIAGFGFWVHTDHFSSWLTKELNARISENTGEIASLSGVDLDFFPIQVKASAFTLSRTSDKTPILEVGEVHIPLSSYGGKLAAGIITLHSPTVMLAIDANGKLDAFQQMGGGQASSTKLPFTGLHILDGSFSITSGENTLSINQLEITPNMVYNARVRGSLNITTADRSYDAPIYIEKLITAPDRVDMSPLELDLFGATTLVDFGHVPGAEQWLSVDSTIDLANFYASLNKSASITGTTALHLHWSKTPSGQTTEIKGSTVQIQRKHTRADGSQITQTPPDTQFSGNISDGRVVLDTIEMALDKGTLTGSANIGLNGDIHEILLSPRNLSLREYFIRTDASQAPWLDLTMDAEIQATGSMSPLLLEGNIAIDGEQFIVKNMDMNARQARTILAFNNLSGQGAFRYQNQRLEVNVPNVSSAKNTLSGQVIYKFKTGLLDFGFSFSQADLSEFRPLSNSAIFGTGRVEGRIYGLPGQLKLTGKGNLKNFEVAGIPYAHQFTADILSPDLRSLQLRNVQARRGSTHYTGFVDMDFRDPFSLDTQVNIDKGRVEDLLAMFIDIEGVNGELSGSLRLKGPLYHMNGVTNLQFSDTEIYGEGFTQGTAKAHMDEGIFSLDKFHLLRGDGTEGFSARGSISRGYATEIEVIGSGFNLATMDHTAQSPVPVSGNVSLHGVVGGTLFEPEPRGTLTLTKARIAENPIPNSYIDFNTTNGDLKFLGSLVGSTMNVNGKVHLWERQDYRLIATLQAFPFHSIYPKAVDGSPIVATLTGGLQLQGNLGDTPSPIDLSLVANEVFFAWDGHQFKNKKSWEYQQRGAQFSLQNFDLHSPHGAIQLSSNGDGENVTVTGQGALPLDLLRIVVPGLQTMDGTANITMSAYGPKDVRNATVDVSLAATALKHDSFPAPFEDLQSSFQVTHDKISIKKLTASLGGGSVTGNGSIATTNWRPTRFDLKMESKDTEVQWVDYLPPAIGDATLTFNGPIDALLLAGDVDINEMVFVDRIDWEDWVVEWRSAMLVEAAITDTAPLFSFDIGLHADETISLQNNIADGTASAELRVVGDTNVPGMTGWARVIQGEMYLQDRIFNIDRGRIDYRDPLSWDPELSFDLLTDIQSNEQNYRVDLQVRGPFSDWTTTTSSTPALAQADINALLWFGATFEELQEMGEFSQALVQGVADIILADLLVSTQAGNFRADLPFFVERIEVVTGVNARGEYSSEPRLLVDTEFKDFGGLQMTGEINFVRSDDQFIRLDKELSDTWSLSGWYATKQRDRQLPIGGAFGVDLRARWERE